MRVETFITLFNISPLRSQPPDYIGSNRQEPSDYVRLAITNGLIGGTILLLLLLYNVRFIYRVPMCCALLVICTIVNGSLSGIVYGRTRSSGLHRWILGLGLGFVFLKASHATIQCQIQGGIDAILTEWAIAIVPGLYFWLVFRKACQMSGAFWFTVIALAYGIYSTVNLGAYWFGISHVDGNMDVFGIGGTANIRMLPPAAKSITNYGTYAIVGVAGGMFVSMIQHKKPLRIIGIVSMCACAVACWWSEVRMAIYAVALSIGFTAMYWLARPLCGLVPVIAFAIMVIVPLLFNDTYGIGLLSELMPVMVIDNLSRSAGDMFTLGGRSYIYGYGLSLLSQDATPWYGLGPLLRDASPVLVPFVGGGELPVTVSFHNGFLEMCVAHGPVVGTIVFGVIGIALGVLAWRARRFRGGFESGESITVVSVLGIFVSLCSVATLENVFNEYHFLFVAFFSLSLAFRVLPETHAEGVALKCTKVQHAL